MMNERRGETVRLPMLDGGSLHVYLSFDRPDQDFAVVYIHGFGSTRSGQKAEALEAACRRRCWTFASFDFRGHGQSSGSLLELRGTGLLEDIETVRDYLVGRGIRRLCPVGSSMGGWAAAWFTLRHPQIVPACILIAPALDFLRSRWAMLTPAQKEQWQETGKLRVQSEWVNAEIGYGVAEERDAFPATQLAAELSRPILIFHGLKDDVVDPAHSLNLARNALSAATEVRFFGKGGHRLLAFADEMAEETCRFLARHLANGGNCEPGLTGQPS
jgi:pimeloyl-ACP methyl ester carboxylesterase